MRRTCLIALLPLAACSQGAQSDHGPVGGASVNRTWPVAGFSAIDATGPDDVDVRVGSGFSVRAEGDAKVVDRLDITRDGDSLSIGRKSQAGFNWGSDHGVKIYVTMPRITAARITGSGNMTVDHVEGDAFTGRTTGAGELSLSSITVRTLSLNTTGAGNVRAAGTTGAADLSTTGAGDIAAPELKARSATVSVLGAGSVKAAVTGPATVKVTGPGDVTLTGGANCTVSKLGPGDVTCS